MQPWGLVHVCLPTVESYFGIRPDAGNHEAKRVPACLVSFILRDEAGRLASTSLCLWPCDPPVIRLSKRYPSILHSDFPTLAQVVDRVRHDLSLTL